MAFNELGSSVVAVPVTVDVRLRVKAIGLHAEGNIAFHIIAYFHFLHGGVCTEGEVDSCGISPLFIFLNPAVFYDYGIQIVGKHVIIEQVSPVGLFVLIGIMFLQVDDGQLFIPVLCPVIPFRGKQDGLCLVSVIINFICAVHITFTA